MQKTTNIEDILQETEEDSDSRKRFMELNREWVEREGKRRKTLEFIPFPDNLPGWQLKTLLYLDDRKWKSKMKAVIRDVARTYGMKGQEIEEKCLELMGDLLPVVIEVAKKREEEDIKDAFDAVSINYEAKWRFMEILGGMIVYLKENAVTVAKTRITAQKEVITEEQQRALIAQYYVVKNKKGQNTEDDRRVDLKLRDPVIMGRMEKMTTAMNQLKPYLIEGNDKRRLWTIVCDRMPLFTEFCNALGDRASWKMYFTSSSRKLMIAPVDVFYEEFNQAVAEIKKEYHLTAEKNSSEKERTEREE